MNVLVIVVTGNECFRLLHVGDKKFRVAAEDDVVGRPHQWLDGLRGIIPGDGDGNENSSLTVIVKTVRNVQSVNRLLKNL